MVRTMREDLKRLREVILRQIDNNGLKGERAAEAEYFIILGYLAMQGEIGETIDPYLTMLIASGRRLTEEKVT